MKILPYILVFSNLLLVSSEPDRRYMYRQNTCNRSYWDGYFLTDKERERCSECSIARFEVYDRAAKKYIAHIAYTQAECYIAYLRVDTEYSKKGIGTELVRRAIEDMRVNHGCQEISLISSTSAEKFWEKLGAKPRRDFTHVFSAPVSNKGS